METNSELYENAKSMAIKLFGSEFGDLEDAPLADDDPWRKELVCWVFGYLFSERAAIPLKEKVLALIAMCSTAGKYEMLRKWLVAAKNTGSSYAEVQDVILTTTIYGGWPVASESLKILKQNW